jgi:AraC-like DNA-binding protein
MCLLPAGKSVKEVAADLGFKHCSDFTRFFKRKTGESPRQFRARFPKANKYSAKVPQG